MGSWDALRDLHSLILERERVWGQVATHYRYRLDVADAERERVIEDTAHSMRKVRRECVEASPVNGDRYFGELVEETPAVSAATDRVVETRSLYESAAERRRAETATDCRGLVSGHTDRSTR